MGKEKLLGPANGIFGGMSIISSYNVCHSVCMSLISVLTFFGIAVAGMPLAFLTPYQIYFWTFGIVILAIALILHKIKGPCISKHMILANSGLLLAGIPFANKFYKLFLMFGFAIVAIAIAWWANERWMRKKS